MVPWFRAFTVLSRGSETGSQNPHSSQPPVTPAPGDPTPSSVLSRHLYTCCINTDTHTYTNTHMRQKNKNKIFQKVNITVKWKTRPLVTYF